MSRITWMVFSLALMVPSAVNAAPWLFASPLLFGQEAEERSNFLPLANPNQKPLVDLSLPDDFEESELRCCESACNESLAAECLKYWNMLWQQGRFDLAPVVANKACQLDPNNIACQHACVVSRIIAEVFGHLQAENECCIDRGCPNCVICTGCPTAVCTVQKSGCRDAAANARKGQFELEMQISWPFDFAVGVKSQAQQVNRQATPAPNMLRLVGFTTEATGKKSDLVHSVAPMARVSVETKNHRIHVAGPNWRAECDRLAYQGAGQAFLEGNVRVVYSDDAIDVTAPRLWLNLNQGTLQLERK